MSLKCGIVGLPNVGKSTLFNALTQSAIPAENYPFCTIEPNVGVVEIAELRSQPMGMIVQGWTACRRGLLSWFCLEKTWGL